VPVLARTLEAEGFSTILVTNMPYWSEKTGVPRTLAVEFPFGHILGQPCDTPRQMSIISQALQVLADAREPGVVIHAEDEWPQPSEEATTAWQPEAQSPIIAYLRPQIREVMRQRRRK
jgi:hypothetical protein